MARKTTVARKATAAPKVTTTREPTAPRKKATTVSHLFQVQLREAKLTRAQAQRVAKAIRAVTAKELLKMDFRIEELNRPLFDSENASNCGGCSSCSS